MRIDRVKLIAEMARQDMTVQNLAEKSGLSRVTITGVRSGKTCSDKTANKLAQGLGVSIETLRTEG
ncbi:MAG TPA: helix-turn-helix transcriptional regulator [Firmicutes bacterium]|nr:helix-turn-helix transcriptional regulator [Bacillota bacterium]